MILSIFHMFIRLTYVFLLYLKVFNANYDYCGVEEILFGVTVSARTVRIWPLTKDTIDYIDSSYYALRFEILGCVNKVSIDE